MVYLELTEEEYVELHLFFCRGLVPYIKADPDISNYQIAKLIDIQRKVEEHIKDEYLRAERRGENNG